MLPDSPALSTSTQVCRRQLRGYRCPVPGTGEPHPAARPRQWTVGGLRNSFAGARTPQPHPLRTARHRQDLPDTNYALSIIEGRPLDELGWKPPELRRRFNEYVRNGRVVLRHFSPVFSYEDFVEGIKPYAERAGALPGGNGIFKVLCRDAHRSVLESVCRHYPGNLPWSSIRCTTPSWIISKEEWIPLRASRKDHPAPHPSLRRPVVAPAQVFRRSAHKEEEPRSWCIRSWNCRSDRGNRRRPAVPSSAMSTLPCTGAYSGAEKVWWTTTSWTREEENGTKATLLLELDEFGTAFELPLVPDHILSQCNKYVLIIDEINGGNILYHLRRTHYAAGRGQARWAQRSHHRPAALFLRSSSPCRTSTSSERWIPPTARRAWMSPRRRTAFRVVPAGDLIPRLGGTRLPASTCNACWKPSTAAWNCSSAKTTRSTPASWTCRPRHYWKPPSRIAHHPLAASASSMTMARSVWCW